MARKPNVCRLICSTSKVDKPVFESTDAITFWVSMALKPLALPTVN